MTASEFIKEFSARTWSDIRFARNNAGIIRLGEVTVTQNLILSIAYRYHDFPGSVYLFEARDEKVNGNDIELFILNSGGKLIAYPCQAKIVDKKPKETYSQINHSSKSSSLQIDALLNYSKKLKGFPLYLLYNYSKVSLSSSHSVKEKADSYGCTYVPASYLKHHHCSGGAWLTPLPTFKDLHPLIGKPFYHLFELGSKTTPEIELELKGSTADPANLIEWPIREYTLDELRSDSAWEAVNYFQDSDGLEELGKIPILKTRDIESSAFTDGPNVFAPKYRLIFVDEANE